MFAIDLIVAIPLVLAVVAYAVGRANPHAPRWIVLGASLLQLGLAASVVPAVAASGLQVSGITAARPAGLLLMTADGLSLPLVILTALTGLVAVSASWRVDSAPGSHFALLALLQAAVAAVFLADDIIVFYIAWESVLIPMFLLIGGWGSGDARRAAMKFLVYTFAGGAVLLFGIIALIVHAGTTSLSMITEAATVTTYPAYVFWLLLAGFLVKLPAVPLHTWLPDAHTEAPTAGSVVLAGVLLKMGGYGVYRFVVPLFPATFADARTLLVLLGVIGIVWGAATALVQSDLKRLVAYSSVAHMGFVLVAAGVATPSALAAGLITMVSHGLVAGLLFYLVGAVYTRTHTREIAAFGGLGAVAPRWATAFVFASLASAGLPGLSGFPGEFVTVIETFARYPVPAAVAGAGVVLAAAYNLRAIRSTVQGPAGTATAAGLTDLSAGETATAGALAAVIVILGIGPWLVADLAEPALRALATVAGGVR